MDMNDLFSLGASLLKSKLGNTNENVLQEALASVLGGKDGGLDLSSITSALQNGSLGSIVSSWIGSGENAPIDANGVKELLGEDKIGAFAQKLGIDHDSAADALKDVLPQVVDKATPEGDSLLESMGGLDGLMGMAKNFF